ncbi:hypothetical protein J2T14_005789 [Paenibacillus harenae]|nr:hypothetical protein [Paenibacillus harenae]
MDTEGEALKYAGTIVSNQLAGTTVKRLFSVNVESGAFVELDFIVENMALAFREKSGV